MHVDSFASYMYDLEIVATLYLLPESLYVHLKHLDVYFFNKNALYDIIISWIKCGYHEYMQIFNTFLTILFRLNNEYSTC